MKKQLKKLVALVMAGAVFVLQAAVPVQAQTLPAEESSEEVMAEAVTPLRTYNYTSKRTITGNSVNFRRYANLSSEVMLVLNKGDTITVDTVMVFADKTYWYPAKRVSNGKTYYGFVARDYVSH